MYKFTPKTGVLAIIFYQLLKMTLKLDPKILIVFTFPEELLHIMIDIKNMIMLNIQHRKVTHFFLIYKLSLF